MKYLHAGAVVVSLFLFVATIGAQEEAEWKKVKVQTSVTLQDVAFVDGKLGWTCGADGTVLSTGNGGDSWSKQKTGVSRTLRSIDAVNGKMVWAVGGGYKMSRPGAPADDSEKTVIVHTDDGGENWNEIPHRPQHGITGGYFPLTDIEMFTKKKGWLAQGLGRSHPDGDVFYTKDGGNSWSRPGSGRRGFKPRMPVFDLEFSGRQHGWGTGANTAGFRRRKGNYGNVLHTSDGGESWTVQEPEEEKNMTYLFGVSAVDKKHVQVCGQDGKLYASEDGGERWAKQKTGTDHHLYDIDFRDADHGICVGQNGTLLVTGNGGSDWSAAPVDVNTDLLAVSFLGRKHAVVAGADGTILLYSK